MLLNAIVSPQDLWLNDQTQQIIELDAAINMCIHFSQMSQVSALFPNAPV